MLVLPAPQLHCRDYILRQKSLHVNPRPWDVSFPGRCQVAVASVESADQPPAAEEHQEVAAEVPYKNNALLRFVANNQQTYISWTILYYNKAVQQTPSGTVKFLGSS